MYTIGRLAKKYGLSRSTLLYYDSIDLLKPTGRSAAGYRLYSEKDASRLERIKQFRRAGLPLEEIKSLLDASGKGLVSVLENRLVELNNEIKRLRGQQTVIVELLKNRKLFDKIGFMNRETWVGLLRASGFSDEDMAIWHAEFEKNWPDKHQEFMEFLCIPEDEIKAIRQVQG